MAVCVHISQDLNGHVLAAVGSLVEVPKCARGDLLLKHNVCRIQLPVIRCWCGCHLSRPLLLRALHHHTCKLPSPPSHLHSRAYSVVLHQSKLKQLPNTLAKHTHLQQCPQHVLHILASLSLGCFVPLRHHLSCDKRTFDLSSTGSSSGITTLGCAGAAPEFRRLEGAGSCCNLSLSTSSRSSTPWPATCSMINCTKLPITHAADSTTLWWPFMGGICTPFYTEWNSSSVKMDAAHLSAPAIYHENVQGETICCVEGVRLTDIEVQIPLPWRTSTSNPLQDVWTTVRRYFQGMPQGKNLTKLSERRHSSLGWSTDAIVIS